MCVYDDVQYAKAETPQTLLPALARRHIKGRGKTCSAAAARACCVWSSSIIWEALRWVWGGKWQRFQSPFAPPCRSGCFLPGRCFHPLVKMSPAQQEQLSEKPRMVELCRKAIYSLFVQAIVAVVVVSCCYLLSPLLCFFPFFFRQS